VEKKFDDHQGKIVVEKDQNWGQIVDFGTYGGNLYLLDQKNLTLFRYPVIETGFGTKQSWVKSEESLLSGAISMAINGSIWILKGNGEITKFTHGLADPFGIGGLDKDFFSPEAIYTDIDQNSLYVLDKGNQRVVVLDKGGEYQAQYIWPQPAEVNEIVVSEEKGKIWLLGGSKIYEIEIRK